MGDDIKPQVGKDLLTLAQASRALAEAHWADNDWSGLPVPVPGLDLVLEPRYKRKELGEFRWKECYDQDGVRCPIEPEEPPKPSDYTAVNSWFSSRLQVTITVFKDNQGHARFDASFESRLAMTIRTLEAVAAWPVEAEKRALKKLASLITSDLFDQYLLTGHFSEISKRSQLLYLFRKGRPTVVIHQNEDEGGYPLCALCLHPIGYYANTWAGAMCPTDEVIAHLLMMRGSEDKYWANANQHPVDHPAAGV